MANLLDKFKNLRFYKKMLLYLGLKDYLDKEGSSLEDKGESSNRNKNNQSKWSSKNKNLANKRIECHVLNKYISVRGSKLQNYKSIHLKVWNSIIWIRLD